MRQYQKVLIHATGIPEEKKIENADKEIFEVKTFQN